MIRSIFSNFRSKTMFPNLTSELERQTLALTMSSWQLIGSSPFMASWGSLHHGINPSEIMYVSRRYLNYATLESPPSGIHIYDTFKHRWRRYEHAPDNIEHHTACFDQKNKILYIKDASANIFIINFINKTYKSFKSNTVSRINASFN